MAKRLFEDNDAWANVASRCNNELVALFADVLVKVEEALGEPVDLRDFHFVGANALASFVAELSIRRRLGDGDEGPRKIEQDYPRLPLPFDDNNLVEGIQKWECAWSTESDTWRDDNGFCLYNHTEDPMHDNCILCGQPEERK